MAKIDRTSGVPIYRQIKQILVADIEASDGAGPVMTEEELLRRFRVSRAPIRQALRELSDEGVVYRERAKGTFPVRRSQVKRPSALKFGGLISYLQDRGLHPVTEVAELDRSRPPASVAASLELAPDEDVFTFSRQIALEGGAPVFWARLFIRSPEEFRPTAEELKQSGSAFSLLARDHGINITRSEHVVWLTGATPEESRGLQVPEGSPVLVVETLGFTKDGRPGTWRRSAQLPDELKLVFESNDPLWG
ncbi:GntR family transcriptional regulator [Microbacterium pseudoresistens]|uniref:GntR family transcriptional regulator n=1 Tax=Microbacterium pseudoresistens TaxID=640634 RepID=A0A7Y9EU95_9MICO|nr:GntR family transcriptional regulator [Microbacterium pseudoresistens]NYD53951.1 GntR family transcriptional regulator [Microbacterium pseudoresistens]